MVILFLVWIFKITIFVLDLCGNKHKHRTDCDMSVLCDITGPYTIMKVWQINSKNGLVLYLKHQGITDNWKRNNARVSHT
jgi:hypothetical protein